MSRRQIETAAICTAMMAALLFRVPTGASVFSWSVRLIVETSTILAVAVVIAMRVNLWVGAMLALAAVSAAAHWDVYAMIGRDGVLFGALWFSLIVIVRPNRDVVLSCLGAAALVNSVAMVVQWLGCDWWSIVSAGAWHTDAKSLPTGIMGGRNESGALMAMAYVAFIRPGRIRVFPLAVYSAGLILSFSTAPLAAVFLAMAWAMYVCKPRMWWIAIASLAAVLVAYAISVDKLPMLAITERLRIWRVGAAMLDGSPLTGIGIGHWHAATRIDYAQSWIMEWAVEMGVAFPVVAAGYLIDAARRYRGDVLMGIALLIVMVGGLASYWLQHPVTAIAAVTIMGLYQSENGKIDD